MEPYQERVVEEEKELRVKLDKLKLFIQNRELFNRLPVAEQARLCYQELCMTGYLDILRSRIGNSFR